MPKKREEMVIAINALVLKAVDEGERELAFILKLVANQHGGNNLTAIREEICRRLAIKDWEIWLDRILDL